MAEDYHHNRNQTSYFGKYTFNSSIFEATENVEFIDACVYNPTLLEMVVNKGTVLGSVLDMAATFPHTFLPQVKKKDCQINEINLGKSEDPDIEDFKLRIV